MAKVSTAAAAPTYSGPGR